MRQNFFFPIIFFFLITFQTSLFSQQVIGLLQHSTGSLDSGYVLFAPTTYTNTYLIDKCGKFIHSWPSAYKPGHAVYLLEDGSILHTGDDVTNTIFNGGGRGGFLEIIDWDGNITWSYKVSDANQCQHHDVKMLPNGNILVIAWERKPKTLAVAAGRDPSTVTVGILTEKIVELKPIGADSAEIVWEWHVWDHLIQDFDNTKPNYGVVADHPELINLNFTNGSVQRDWIHMNSVDYNAEFDQIVLSASVLDEIWIIDHSTTTAEAVSHTGGIRGKGGDLLYRWGNPAAYNNGIATDHKLYGQHNAQWIPNGFPHAGKILIFNNGAGRIGGNYSSVDIVSTPVDALGNYNVSTLPYLPVSQDWIYSDPVSSNFYASRISGAQMLKNGNVLICDGPNPLFFEVDSLKNILWKYKNPVTSTGPGTQGDSTNISAVFRCGFYPYSYPAFVGKDLTPGLPVELNPLPYDCELDVVLTEINQNSVSDNSFVIYPNPVRNYIEISNISSEIKKIEVLDCLGRLIKTVNKPKNEMIFYENILPSGLLFFKFSKAQDKFFIKKLIIE